MESTQPTATSTGVLASLPQFLVRKPVPDVPQDIEDVVMEHLNDPNYDLSTLVPSSASTHDSFEINEKKRTSFSHGYTGTTDVDSESQADSSDRVSTSAPDYKGDEVQYNDESPYPEVRAAVASVDDPTMPVSTVRMWFLGVIYTILIVGLNQFFSFRYPSVFVTGLVVQLTSLPAGKLLEYILPRYRFCIGRYSLTLNPGPFNVKEHTVITVMANVSAMGAYASDVILTQRLFYNQNWSVAYQLLLCLSSQLIGYSFAGMIRQFVVWPSSMIWPGALVNAALFNTLHRNYGKTETKHMSREKFFILAAISSFVWYWVPGYLWTGLSVFNWVCWIAPNNIVINQLFGTVSGLGLGLFTFDWSMISYIGSPLVTPWWAELNTFVSFVIFFWIITPIVYYTNTFYSKFLPMSSITSFDRFGNPYDPTAIVTDGVFDVEKYRNYSPMFLSATFAVSYGPSFAVFSAVVVHVFLWYRRDIVRQFRRTLRDERDVHSRLMRAYPEVPHWWYAALGAIAFVPGVVAITVWDTHLPVWAYILALLLSMCFCLPASMIQAITNQQITIHVLVELLIGYMLPGRPVAMMIFKTYGYVATQQATTFSGDLKLGHYMKVPPRIMFIAQTIATCICCVVVIAVQTWMFSNIPDFCSPDQKHGFICPSSRTFATASLIWGGIGPSRFFSYGALYYPLVYFFLIGAIAPIPFYFLARRYPHSFWRYINMPVFFAGVGALPPASGINYSAWALVGFIFQYWMRRFHFRWWMRYNYILSAALDSGIALSVIIIFFGVLFPKGGINVNWWGNIAWMNTADAMGLPLITPDPNVGFGPTTWS
ncbi:hypothetical protein JAAARDRAFT_37990 [Jaapia argillacea MUCL 33604]|uniref:OPT oligopeptide transporter n=1 Tax=Jaapia argillacea MUCL 33604 TaxID=933084 RepID=A0A067PIZ2_9AGAM|nr:hypothetical protein JAAARDRAFT_37990 [Jaapia argillacea MUCL 33604]